MQNLADKVVGHDVPLTDDEKKAIDTIKQYITRLLKDIETQRNQDQNEVNRYRQSVASCGQTAESLLNGKISTERENANTARQNHITCRKAEVEVIDETSTACQKYNLYRSSPPGNDPPKCMSTLTGADVASTDPTTRKSMEQCITAIYTWVDPLYDHYIKCKDAGSTQIIETRKCDGKQHYFEAEFCLYAGNLEAVCSTQDSCRQLSIGQLQKGDAEVKVAEKAREADCKVGYQVRCLLGIFEETNNAEKPGMLKKCKELKPTCPESIVFPPTPGPHPCHPEPNEPCDAAWIQKEYTSQPWFAKAPTTHCNACHPPKTCRATLYEDASFGGFAASFPPGRYETKDLRRLGCKDDAVSAIKVEAPCSAVLYKNPDLTGDSAIFPPGSYSGTAFTDKFPDDVVSSLLVESNLK